MKIQFLSCRRLQRTSLECGKVVAHTEIRDGYSPDSDENPVFEPCASAQERIVSGTGNGIGRDDAAQFAAFPHAEISADGERESRFKDVERRPKMSVVPKIGHWEVVK